MTDKPPFGWKAASDGGYVRDPMQSEEHRPRTGMWCKIVNLVQATHMNNCFVEVTSLPDADGGETCEVTFDGDKFTIGVKNLVPLPGASETAPFHKDFKEQVSLMVNGINCDGCKTSLKGVLMGIEGACDINIATKAETGVHPNAVTVKGASLAAITNAIDTLDAGRGKFTVVN